MLASFPLSKLLTVVLAFSLSVSAASSHQRSSHRRHHARQALRRNETDDSPLSSAVVGAAKGKSNKGEYSVVDRWAGKDFFDGWNFFSQNDPTHGLVNYLSESEATSKGLAYVDNDGNAVMKVDSTSNLGLNQHRNSVRIATNKRYDGGLFILDVDTMPYGWAVWPAFWTVGNDWPNHGEIDIVEGVNNNNQNQYTLHTAPGCKTDTSNTAPESYSLSGLSSKVTSTTCGSSKSSNSGCAFIDSSKSSYGQSLNAAGGAVFAMLWSDDGIKIWNFPRDSIPNDITSQNPSPSQWDSQYLKAAWAASTCSTKQYFKQHAITFDITLCGDWAGAAYKSSGGPGSCAQHVQTGSNFKNAVWKVKSVTVYQ